jgi:hypothetical protein
VLRNVGFEGTNMATLWEMMVFSLSSKFWKVSGLRTCLGSVLN